MLILVFLPPSLPSFGGEWLEIHERLLQGLDKGRVSPTESAGTFAHAGKGGGAYGYNWPAFLVSGGTLSDHNTVALRPEGTTTGHHAAEPLPSTLCLHPA